MLFKDNETITEEYDIVINISKDGKSQYIITIALLLMIVLMFLYEFGYFGFIGAFLIFLYGAFSASYIFSCIKIGRFGINYSFFKIKKYFYWRDIKTIRYEKHYRKGRFDEVIFFSVSKTKRPKWLDSDLVFVPFKNSITIYLSNEETYTDKELLHSYPKYEFLDKLKEWGVKIEIDEKYLKSDPTLRKYVSSDNDIEEIINDPNEWIIDNHIIKVNEEKNHYIISYDGEVIKRKYNRDVRRWGLEETIVIDNEEYLLVYENRKFDIIKNAKYLGTDRRYIPRIMEWIVIAIGTLLILSCVVIRLFNLFPTHIDTIILLLSTSSVIIMGTFRFIKRRD